MLQQMLRMRDAGQPLPDILGAEDSFLIETFYDAGLIESHDDIAAQWEEEDPEQYGLLLPLVWDETAVEDGTKTGMSVTANFDILYYNSEWFEEAGVTVPFDSLDAVLDGMRAMKEARPDGIPLTVQARAGDGVTTLKTVLAAIGHTVRWPDPRPHVRGWPLHHQLVPPSCRRGACSRPRPSPGVRTRPGAPSSRATQGSSSMDSPPRVTSTTWVTSRIRTSGT